MRICFCRLADRFASLLDRTRDCRERIVGVTANQPDRTDHDDQDDGEHDGILSDILSLVPYPQLPENLSHVCPLLLFTELNNTSFSSLAQRLGQARNPR
jgi:hypothetical protein